MPEELKCPKCGKELPEGVPAALCPVCLWEQAQDAKGQDTNDILVTMPPPSSKANSPVREKEASPATTTRDDDATLPAESGSITEPANITKAGTKVRYMGDYELVDEIARGGMGVVYRARQLSLNREVALKMILAGQLAGDEDVIRFHTEAEAAANLQHPNIVSIYEVGEHEGHHYFSMELVEGGNLKDRIKDCNADHRLAAQLIVKTARAIHHAHQRGILHRDLKPANVLLDKDDEPHITDFGLAKQVESDNSLTMSGAAMGTPQYMSPEQAKGDTSNLTTATDVYSLGVILYQLLTGSLPHKGSGVLEIMRNVVDEEPATPSSINRRVDKDLETICLKCLSKEPEKRYGSAEALAEDLERWLNNEPILARRSSGTERLVKWARRKPGIAGLAALSIALLLSFLAYLQSSKERLRHEATVQTQLREAADFQTQEAQNAKQNLQKAFNRIQAGQIKNLFADDLGEDALANLAFMLRGNPSNRVATSRLMSALTDRNWATLAAPTKQLDSKSQHLFSFSQHSDQFVTSHNNNKGLWKPFTHNVFDLERGSAIHARFNFSGGGRFVGDGLLATEIPSNEQLLIWRINKEKKLLQTIAIESRPIATDFSSDGTKVIAAFKNGTAIIWDIKSGQEWRRFSDTNANFRSIFFLRKSDSFVSFSASRKGNKKLVKLWNAGSDFNSEAGLNIQMQKWPTDREMNRDLLGLSFLPIDGYHRTLRLLLGFPHNGDFRVRDLVSSRDLTPIRRLDGCAGNYLFGVKYVEFPLWIPTSGDEFKLAHTLEGNSISVVDGLTYQSVKTLSMPAWFRELSIVRFSPSGLAMATECEANDRNSVVQVWDLADDSRTKLPIKLDTERLSLSISRDDSFFAWVSDQGELSIWEAQGAGQVRRSYPNQKILEKHEPHLFPFSGSKIQGSRSAYAKSGLTSPNGRHIVRVANKKHVEIRSAITKEMLLGPLAHLRQVGAVGFNETETMFFTVTDGDKSGGPLIRVWDIESGQPLIEPVVGGNPRFSKGGNSLIGESNGEIWVMDISRVDSPAPDWLPELVDAVSGKRIDANGVMQEADRNDYFRIKREIESSDENDEYTKWAKWFFADRESRNVSPWTDLPVREYLKRVRQHPTLGGLKTLVKFERTNAVAMVDLAEGLVGHNPGEADWLSRRALDLAPTNAHVVETRGRIAAKVLKIPDVAKTIRWHEWQADYVELLGQWTAADYHLRRLIEYRPADESLRKRLALAVENTQRFFNSAKEQPNRQKIEKRAVSARESGFLSEWLIPSRNPDGLRQFVDLAPFFNVSLDESLNTRVKGNDLRSLPRGFPDLGGVRFDTRAVVQLDGKRLSYAESRYPSLVDKIPVGDEVQKIHFLQGCRGAVENGVKVGAYHVHFSDNSTMEIPLVFGVNIADWWEDNKKPTNLSDAEIVWKGLNPPVSARKKSLQLVKFSWENPKPDMKVTSINYVSALTDCAPFLIAITTE